MEPIDELISIAKRINQPGPIDELVAVAQTMSDRGVFELIGGAKELARRHPKTKKPCQIIHFPQSTRNSRANTTLIVDSET